MNELPMNDLYFFDTQTEIWNFIEEQHGSPPPPRSFHKMVSIGADLYVFGGCGAENRLNDFYKFDTNTLTWT
jgi:N-acetylneuraminic acid mutarotase